MPDPFVDHVVPEPRRFDIQADGNDGTDIITEVNGKTVKFLENFGTPSQQGTPLSATELNKRIIGDFEDKTFTELRTLLDTLNIDKDQNANMVVNKILMRTLYNKTLNGDFGDGATTNWSLVGSATFAVVNNVLQFTASSSGTRFQQSLRTLIGQKVLRIGRIKSTSSNVGIGDTSSILTAHSGSGNFEILVNVRTETVDNRNVSCVDVRGSAWDQVEVDWIMGIVISNTYLESLTDAQIKAQLLDYFEGKAKTVNPHLLTIGKNIFDLTNVFGIVGNPIKIIENNDLIIKNEPASTFDILKYELDVVPNKNYNLDTIATQVVGALKTGRILVASSSDGSGVIVVLNLTITPETVNLNFNAGDNNKVYLFLYATRGVLQTSELKYSNLMVYEDTGNSDYAAFNTNENNKFGFEVEGNSVTNDVETVEDIIELRNNRYIHTKKIKEDEVNFQAIGGLPGNWTYDAGGLVFQIDFATLGIDPNFVAGVQSLARIVIDGDVYTNDLAVSDFKFIFAPGVQMISGNDGIIIKNLNYTISNNFAAYIAAATEVVFDFYMKVDDWEENVIAATGFTVIEENGTVIEENDEVIAYETETEIPVNVPAAIKEAQLDIRRLFNIKNEYVILEDFRSDNLDIPSTGTPGILTTDKMSEIYSSYILLYEVPFVLSNEGLGIQRLEFINPYFTNPISGSDQDIKKKLGRIRNAAAGGDDFSDYEFTLYFKVATPNQLGIGNGAYYLDTKKTATTNVYTGRVSSPSINVVALLGVKSNE